MNVKLLLVLVGSLLSAVAAESKRETELMEQIEASGLDDEDSDSYDESSGSGYSDEDEETDDYIEFTDDTPTTTLGNHIEENGFRNTKTSYEVVQQDNDLKILRKAGYETQSNEISMASTSHGFFSRTEVVIAVVAGGLVGLVFAIIIVLLVMRVRKNKKNNLAYDTVKKPIYKKAPTIEA